MANFLVIFIVFFAWQLKFSDTELIERGIANIKKLAVVFIGKDVYVKEKGRPI